MSTYYVNVGITFAFEAEDRESAEDLAFASASEIYGEHFAREAWYATERGE